MAYDEVYLSLQQGAIDGASAPPHVFLADKFVETSDYYNLTRAFYLPAMAAMSQKTWDGLTEEQQKIIEDRKSTRLNSSHVAISYAVFCLKKKKIKTNNLFLSNH